MNLKTQSELKNISQVCIEKITYSKEDDEYFTKPYKHLVIDNFFPTELAELCLQNFPDLNENCWEYANEKDIEIKYRTTWQSEFDVPEGIIDAVRILNSGIFLLALGERFNIPKLIPDCYFSGGGLNATKQGGLLDVHVDGNYHDPTGLNRRMNVLIYLNKNWQKEWGGEFGVYDNEGKTCLKKVAPLFNRMVAFDSHDYSFHGLPEPINFPKEEFRKSILLYYYTLAPRPLPQTAVQQPHSALWVKRDLMDKRGNKTRNYD